MQEKSCTSVGSNTCVIKVVNGSKWLIEMKTKEIIGIFHDWFLRGMIIRELCVELRKTSWFHTGMLQCDEELLDSFWTLCIYW